MTTHIHLVIQVAEIPLALIMQNLSLRYTKWVNYRVNYTQGRAGHVFQGRYKALLLDSDAHLLELVRYVHLNPVRAVMVKLPEDYPWSGHRAYLGRETLPGKPLGCRGRDAGYPAPPAQIPASGFPALGSCIR